MEPKEIRKGVEKALRWISLAFIQKQLGHASIQTTVDIYGHLVPTEGHQGVEDLAEATKRNPAATELLIVVQST